MSTITRTDIHRPSAPEFDPQAYTLVDVFDLNSDSAREIRDLSEALRELAKDGITQAPHAHGCGHCGQRTIRYVALLVRADVKEWIFVGQDCLASRFTDMTKAKFDALRKAAELQRAKQEKKAAWNAFNEANPVFAYATYSENISLTLRREARELGFNTKGRGGDDHLFASGLNWGLNVLFDIARKARQYGDASTKQVALVDRVLGEQEAKWAAYVEREQAKLDNPAGPAPEGRQSVQGIVVKRDEKQGEDYWGNPTIRFVMTVKLDSGALVWGTEPSSINPEVGSRVEFVATFERKQDDETFAFYKRPAKARQL